MPPRAGAWWTAGLGLALAGFWLALSLKQLPALDPLFDKPGLQRRFQLESWTPLSEVAPLALEILLLSEDDGFFSHEGASLDEILKAAADDYRSSSLRRGGSTITQQLVRTVLLGEEKSVSRKLREIALARQLETRMGKKEILEAWINLARLGPDLRGLGAASRRYFGKKPSGLTPKEAALLAWFLPSPLKRAKAWEEKGPSPAADKKMWKLLDALRRRGRLSGEAFEKEWARPLAYKKP